MRTRFDCRAQVPRASVSAPHAYGYLLKKFVCAAQQTIASRFISRNKTNIQVKAENDLGSYSLPSGSERRKKSESRSDAPTVALVRAETAGTHISRRELASATHTAVWPTRRERRKKPATPGRLHVSLNMDHGNCLPPSLPARHRCAGRTSKA